MATPLLNPQALASHFWDNDASIIQGRETVQGTAISRFGDDLWDLRCIALRPNIDISKFLINFAVINDPLRRLTAKELMMQRLNRPLPTSKRSTRPKPISALTAADMVILLNRVWRFMDDRGIERFADLTQEHLNAFHRALVATGTAPKSQSYVLKIFYWLYESRDWLTHDRLSFLPWNGQSILKIVGYIHPEENLTLRIPEPIMAPLLRWALAYVDWFSADIISTLSKEEELVQTAKRKGKPRVAKGSVAERLNSWVETQRREDRSLPGIPHHGRLAINLSVVAHEIGVSPQSLQYHRESLDAAAIQLGITRIGFGPDISIPPGASVPWRDPFDLTSLKDEARHLIEACYIVCAYLSGMRDSEVQSLRRGCLRPQRDEHGQVLRYKVLSTSYKGKGASGEERTWVVIEPVFRAVETL